MLDVADLNMTSETGSGVMKLDGARHSCPPSKLPGTQDLRGRRVVLVDSDAIVKTDPKARACTKTRNSGRKVLLEKFIFANFVRLVWMDLDSES